MSILDAINSFLVVKETPKMVDEFSQTKMNSGIPVAPFIIIIGKVTESYCIFKNNFVIAQIEACLNSRFLCRLSEDPSPSDALH